MRTASQDGELNIDGLFSAAFEHHRAGRLREAQAGYRQVLQVKADHAPALHYLGLLAHQVEQHDLAVSFLRQAVAADGTVALYFHNLGEAYRALDRHEEAAASYRQSLALDESSADAHYALGNALYELGRLDEAIASYRRAVALAPHDAEALSNLGNALMDKGEREEAETVYRQAIAADPGYLSAYVNLGSALLAGGRADEAIAMHRAALARNERMAEAHLNLGNALARKGSFDEAVSSFQRALSLEPRFAEAHNSLGLALRERREPSAACECFLKAIDCRPRYGEAHTNLGVALLDLRRLDDALGAFREAIKIDPNDAEAHCLLASTLGQRNRLEEAIGSAKRALELRPDLAKAHFTMGLLLEQQGKFEEAVEWQKQALALNPNLTEAHYHATLSRRAEGDAAEIGRIEALLAQDDLNDRQRMNLHFALGKAADDAGRFETAFTHYRAANECKKKDVSFDRENLEPYVDLLIEVFDKQYFVEHSGIGSESDRPVFILGMPRSGTTLVEQIIASHPEVHGAGELEDLGYVSASLPRTLDTELSFPLAATLITKDNARRLAEPYLEALRTHSATARRVTDKMPGNFLRVGLIAVLFPKARIIHTKRDPLDTCLSCYFQNFNRGMHFSYDLEDLGHYYRQYERLMAHWRTVLPGRLLEVQYEELIANQEAKSREIIAHCGLDWDPRCLAFHEHERQVRTASFWQVRQPLYASSVGRWRHYEKHLAPLKAALGLT